MKVLVIGAGGREHALLWKLRRDAPGAELFVTGGNGGTDGLATPLPFAPDDLNGLAGWAESRAVDLTIVGPEGPLAAGVVDVFQRRRLAVFGPTRDAAAIESSKSWAKQLMVRCGVPTAEHASFTSLAEAERHIRERGAPIVVKASGLAAGKGAVVCEGVEEALAAARDMLAGDAFGEAGQEVVIEECMTGEELSVFAITDGERALLMRPAQDHKRIGEGDTGPNTGGMGAYAPVSLVDAALMERIRTDVFEPTLAGMREEKRPFQGLLYAGLMLTPDGPKVVEFNCRFGDPETQALLPLLSSSLLEPLGAVARGGTLEGIELEWADAAAVPPVLASRGYPASSESGVPIDIPARLEAEGDVHVFHAGTALREGRLVTAGGRVLAVTGVASDLPGAAARSRAAADAIVFDGKQHRRDIGWRELERIQAPRAG